MDRITYEVESKIEQTHWWFVGRRRLFKRIISELDLRSTASVLDIGTGTGTNLRLLKGMGFFNVVGIDLHDEAIYWCEEKGLGLVQKGDICSIPRLGESFDLVLATDIIEHVDDDGLALREISRVLRKDGRALLTVPAFNTLWGLQDRVSRHKRRYKKRELEAKLRRSGMKVIECFYFNYLLFVPIWVARQFLNTIKIDVKSENEINSWLLNKVIGSIFRFDVFTSRIISPPFGVSILALVSKTEIGNEEE